MPGTYFVQTDAEANRVTSRLRAGGFDFTLEPDARGHRLTVLRAPAVDVEELLSAYAPSALRL